jgi:hypothetical protein
MNVRGIVGLVALGLLGMLAGLVGSAAARTAFAASPGAQVAAAPQEQAPAVAALAQTTAAPPAPAAPATTPPAAKPGDRHGRDNGFGPGGFGGGKHDGGRGGKGGAGQATADGASRVISATGSLITLVQGDLTYATGKMDTATVADWLQRAQDLLKSAQTASAGSNYGRAVATAQAATGLAQAADLLMQQALGADKLPSYSQRPARGRGGPAPGTTTTTVTQAQASRQLARFYNEILMKDAVVKNAGSAGDAAGYMTIVKNTYSTAYTAYQAGKYNEAAAAVRVGQTLLGVAESLLRAENAPTGTDAPVTVPPPNF